MSEAELHILKMRLRGGSLNKASRGELQTPLPVGYIYDSDGHIILDPDKQVQARVRLVFELYRQLGTGGAVLKHFAEEKILFPRRSPHKIDKGELIWKPLHSYHLFYILHNPRYAGAFAYGRQARVKRAHGSDGRIKRPREEWHALLPNSHEGYISWAEYEANQRQLDQCCPRRGSDDPSQPPREGPALLQGIALCGTCGRRMGVRYYKRADGGLTPRYECGYDHGAFRAKTCQCVTGDKVDRAIEELLLEVVTPMSLEVALNVQQELQQRWEETDSIRRQQVERAQYEAALAQRRYMQVDPDNRLVADSLEKEWNMKLLALNEATQEYERLRQSDRLALDDQQKEAILDLARDFPRLWRNPKVSYRERKQMVRLLIEDVTLVKAQEVKIHVRFKGGATRTPSVPRSKCCWEIKKPDPELIKRIDQLLDQYTTKEIAEILSQQGFRTGTGLPLTGRKVYSIQRAYRLKTRYERLREEGFRTQKEIARDLGIGKKTVTVWRLQGRLKAHTYTERGALMYEPPDPAKTKKYEHVKNRIPAQL